jgi:P-type Ca2+ transporter type 2C
VHRNWFFIGINFIMVGGQMTIIFVGGKAFHVTPLNGPQWGYSIALGAISLPVAVIIRLIPDHFFAKLVPPKWKRGLAPDLVAAKEELDLARPEADLTFIKKLRGGRISSLKFKLDTMREKSEYNDNLMGIITGTSTY